MAAHQAPPSLGFSREEHWSGLPFTHALEHPKHNLSQTSPTAFFFHSLLFISYPPNLHVASPLTVNLTRDGGFARWDSCECSLHVSECACMVGSFSVWLCATLWTAAHQAPLSPGFSRQEHWSGLPFPSPMHESEKWKSSRSVVSNS